MKIAPLYNQVLVKPIDVDLKTKSGIILTENSTAAIKTQQADVVAIGCGMVTPNGGLMPLQVKVGDRVLIPRGVGIEVREFVDSDKLLLIKEQEIFGIFVIDSVPDISAKTVQETLLSVAPKSSNKPPIAIDNLEVPDADRIE